MNGLAAEVPLIPPRYPRVVVALAHHMARRAVEKELRAQGLRPTHIPYVRILAMMDAYKAAHQEELLAQAAALVQRNPKLRAGWLSVRSASASSARRTDRAGWSALNETHNKSEKQNPA